MPDPASPPMLQAEGLCAGYDRVGVLRDVSLTVREGELVTVVGSNGAGKSTLLKVLAGLLPASQGRVTLEGADVTRTRAERRVRAGVALVPEGRRLFGPLSVDENLELGAYGSRRQPAAVIAARRREVFDLFPVLAERVRQRADTLSGGEQQMLAVGRALMSAPRMLLLDEPSLGLAPLVVREIFTALDALRERGVTVLLVEQDAKLALKHADRGYVMRTGRIVLEGAASDLLRDDDVRLIYLGRWHEEGASR
jgi:branched-chain amino acid transport system ATP-binding protein